MIINLWSTPRTGSVWYSYHLARTTPNSMVITEMFNRYHMNIYVHVANGIITNHHQYIDGSYYKEYLVEDGCLTTRKVYAPRSRSVDEEEIYLWKLLQEVSDTKQNLIFHNHVAPMNDSIRQYLTRRGETNLYIYRRDKRAQLGSYAIAYATKQFALFDKSKLSDVVIDSVDIGPLRGLIDRIRVWDRVRGADTIAYEDIQFYDQPGLPVKQVQDYRLRLSSGILQQIEELVVAYENNIHQ